MTHIRCFHPRTLIGFSGLPQIISILQSCFVRGRVISDNILLAEDVLFEQENERIKCSAKIRHGQSLRPFVLAFFNGCYEGIWFWGKMDMTWRLLSGCHFSVLINGESQGF